MQKAELDKKIDSLENLQRKAVPFTEIELKGFDFPQVPVRYNSTLDLILNRIKDEIKFINKIDRGDKEFDFVTKNALKMSLSYLGIYLQDLKTFSKCSNSASRRTVSQGIKIGHFYDSNLSGQKDLTKKQLNQFLMDVEDLLSLVNLIEGQQKES